MLESDGRPPEQHRLAMEKFFRSVRGRRAARSSAGQAATARVTVEAPAFIIRGTGYAVIQHRMWWITPRPSASRTDDGRFITATSSGRPEGGSRAHQGEWQATLSVCEVRADQEPRIGEVVWYIGAVGNHRPRRPVTAGMSRPRPADMRQAPNDTFQMTRRQSRQFPAARPSTRRQSGWGTIPHILGRRAARSASASTSRGDATAKKRHSRNSRTGHVTRGGLGR